jgi:hypothetical protein
MTTPGTAGSPSTAPAAECRQRGSPALKSLYRRVAGIDEHSMKHMVTILIEREDDSTDAPTREVGVFKRDLRASVPWLGARGCWSARWSATSKACRRGQ